MLSSQLISDIFLFAYFVFVYFTNKWLTGRVTFQSKEGTKKINKKQTKNQIYTFIHEDFFSLTRTVEDEEHDTTSTLEGGRVALLSDEGS